jgi:hypothetical protein
VLCNLLEMVVALCGRGRGRLARHRIRARRHDDRRCGIALGLAGGDAVLVVGAVAGEGGDGIEDLVQQVADLGAIIGVVSGQHRGDDLPGAGVQAEVQLPPRPANLGAVLPMQPLACAT